MSGKLVDSVSALERSRREALLSRIERFTELPLLVLSFVMVPLLIGPTFWRLSPSEEAVFVALDTFIWAVFAVDLGVKLAVAPDRPRFLRQHWLEVLVVAIPFLRPFRLLRLVVFGSQAVLRARRLVKVDFLLVYGIGLIIIAATVVTSVESGRQGATITSFPDALWWAVVTITTVGYGDKVPVTTAGRAVAFVLMLGGITFFSMLTANLASLLVRGDDPNKEGIERLASEVRALREEVARLRQSDH